MSIPACFFGATAAASVALGSLGCASCPRSETAPARESGAIAKQPGSVPSDAVPIRIDADGRAFAREQALYKSEDYAKALAKETRKSAAVVTADPVVPYGRVLAVIDELRRHGVVSVDFAPSATSSSGGAAAARPATSPPIAGASSATEAPASATDAPGAPSEPGPPPPGARSLPEVKVETVGLHIGGGPNDDAAKAPFIKALEARFDEFRSCYVKVVEPEKGGTYGVDLKIGRDGGRATLEQPRTGMKGAEFRKCVLGVFESVEFEKPRRGPTVISYSLKFSLLK